MIAPNMAGGPIVFKSRPLPRKLRVALTLQL
jgi:hypothetical protein